MPTVTSPARTRWRKDLTSVFGLFALVDIVTPYAVRLVADLGIADLLVDGPRTVEELAAATGTHAPSLYRVLRALACRDVFTEVSPKCFDLTPMAALLCSDHPLSQRSALTLLPSEIHSWDQFEWGIRTGGVPFDQAHGQPFWDYLEEHTEEGRRFDQTQEAMTKLELLGVLRAYSWQRSSVVVDLGGGNGAFLAGILSHNTSMRGILYDLPHSVANAHETLSRAKVDDRCDVVAGSFFDDVPRGADTYVMKRVFWGHPDEAALRILHNIRRAMDERGRLLVIEPVLEAAARADMGWSAAMGALHDVRLLMFGHGRARTREHIEELLSKAGLRIDRVVPAFVTTIVEAVPDLATH